MDLGDFNGVCLRIWIIVGVGVWLGLATVWCLMQKRVDMVINLVEFVFFYVILGVGLGECSLIRMVLSFGYYSGVSQHDIHGNRAE